MSASIPAHVDCPTCPKADCKAPCGTLDAVGIAPGYLRCAACGMDWHASPEELEQARRAEAAWEREIELLDLEQLRQIEVDRVAAEHAARQTEMWGGL